MTKTKVYLTGLAAIVGGVLYLNHLNPVSGSQLNAAINNAASRININNLVPSAMAGKRIKPADTAASPTIVEPVDAADAITTTDADTQQQSGSVNLAMLSNGLLPNEIQVTADDIALNTPLATAASGAPTQQKIDSQTLNNTEQAIRVLLAPSRETTISSNIAARIVRLNGNLGQSFKAGQVLVSFECSEPRARVDIAKAQLAGSIEEHEAKMKMQGLDQASDVEVALAASMVNKSKAELRLNQTEVNKCRIYAPWSGRIAKAHVKNNMTATPGQPLMEIVDNSALKIKLNVPSKHLSVLKVGKTFNVNIDETGQSYEARISAINSRVDSVSQTVEIEAKMTKRHKELLAGMSGTADFSGLLI